MVPVRVRVKVVRVGVSVRDRVRVKARHLARRLILACSVQFVVWLERLDTKLVDGQAWRTRNDQVAHGVA